MYVIDACDADETLNNGRSRNARMLWEELLLHPSQYGPQGEAIP